MSNNNLPQYTYNGARSMVILHEKHMHSCINTWRAARIREIRLLETDDSDYQSLDTLMRHILRAARGYMTWICQCLELPDPGIDKTPEAGQIETHLDTYTTHLMEKWSTPLADITEKSFHTPVYKSRWGVEYCIDAMLEHAVMHPIRHEFQLNNLLHEQKTF